MSVCWCGGGEGMGAVIVAIIWDARIPWIPSAVQHW